MKAALCVGIDKYGSGSDLQNCVHDMNDWANVLENRDFDVITLADKEATGKNIRDGIAQMIARANETMARVRVIGEVKMATLRLTRDTLLLAFVLLLVVLLAGCATTKPETITASGIITESGGARRLDTGDISSGSGIMIYSAPAITVCTAANNYESHLCGMNAARRAVGLPPLDRLPEGYP